jgi:catechol 2,3-dioxygenase-like lactoylglutathione lyase family enzyme
MDLYLVELAVADWAASLVWYRDRLGLAVELLDEPNRFAVLGGRGGRIALKPGTPVPGGVKLVFYSPDLAAELVRLAAAGLVPSRPVQASAEGYRSVRLTDPDGYVVEVFEWVTAAAAH